jgi:uncharacterized protein (DUF1330 family)
MLTLREHVMKSKYAVAFAMFASFALGAAAVQGLHAQAKPPAFVIAEITVTNQDGYTNDFRPAIGKSIQEYGGKYIAQGGKTLAIRGEPPKPRIVVAQFENMDKVQALIESAGFKSAQPIGDKYATFRLFAVEGLAQ